MSRYQAILVAVLVLWPLTIIALLFLMSHLERYVARSEAGTPEEAGLEPVAGRSTDREVKIVFGGRVVGEAADDGHARDGSGDAGHANATHSTSSRAPLGSADTATAARAGGSAPTNSA